MSRSREEYKQLLQSLLPKGAFWTREKNAILTKLLDGLAEEYPRIESRVEDLKIEINTLYTSELLEEYEEEYSLPDEGYELALTETKRREAINSKKIQIGQQNENYYEDIAAALGYVIVIVQYTPAWSGVAVAGDPCGDQEVLFFWHVYIDVDYLNESIDVNISQLITDINSVKPGHTTVLYDFINCEFGRGFGRAFDRIPHYDNSWIELNFSREFDNSFANAYDYDGVNYTGSFGQGYSLAYDRKTGGDFEFGVFGNGFLKPS